MTLNGNINQDEISKETTFSSNFQSEEFYELNYTKPKDILKIRNICKTFEGKKALNNVSFKYI